MAAERRFQGSQSRGTHLEALSPGPRHDQWNLKMGAMLMSRQQHEHAEFKCDAPSCLPCWRDASMAPGTPS
jgi:hypothetical protein